MTGKPWGGRIRLDPAVLYQTIRLSQAAGYTPTLAELARHLSVSHASAHYRVRQLEQAGLVTIGQGRPMRPRPRRAWQPADEYLRGEALLGAPVAASPITGPLWPAADPASVARHLDPAVLYETLRLSQAAGYTPTLAELGRHLGYGKTTVCYWLARLEQARLVLTYEGQGRRIDLRRAWTPADEALRGRAAGQAIDATPVRLAPRSGDKGRHQVVSTTYDARRVYDFVVDYIAQHHTGPSLTEVADAMASMTGKRRVSKSVANYVLNSLVDAGLLTRAAHRERALGVGRAWTPADERLRGPHGGQYGTP